MQPKPIHILVLFGILACLSLSAQAQESYQLENAEVERDYPTAGGETGSVTLMDGRRSADASDTTSYMNSPAAGARQTGAESKSGKQSSAPQGDGDKDSVLGFNFLYYIIQKFKMSDIVDK